MEKNGKKVLIVEDDEFLGGLLVNHLNDQGFLVYLSTSAEAGLEKAHEIIPDIIILDVLLPKISGFEFLKTIKADAGLAVIPVVILSNLGQKEEVDEGTSLGAVAFLVKANLDLDEITAKIKQIVRI